jgi:hypothetical protein
VPRPPARRGLPVVIDLALEVDLLGEGTNAQKADALFYLTKESFRKHQIEDLWKVRAATSPKSLANTLLSDFMLDALRKELRRNTGHNAEPETLEATLRESVIRPDLLE